MTLSHVCSNAVAPQLPDPFSGVVPSNGAFDGERGHTEIAFAARMWFDSVLNGAGVRLICRQVPKAAG